jgi:hypothetical protein
MGTYVVLLAHPLLGPLNGNLAIPGEGLDPLIVLVSPLLQDLLGNGSDAVHVTEEVHDVLRSRQQRQMTQDDDPVETVVYQCQQIAKEPDEMFHRSSSSFALASTTRASDRGPVEIKEISNIFG